MDIFDEIDRMHQEMDRMFGRMFRGKDLLPGKQGKELAKHGDFRMPVTDIDETDDKVIAKFELPGAEKDNIDLNVTDDSVEVKVEQKAEKEVEEGKGYSYESRSQQFYRKMSLPAEVKADDAVATYKDGILKVEIPKAKTEKKKKKVEIK